MMNKRGTLTCLYVFPVICYLAIFSLDQLGLDHFSSIVKSLGILKMNLVSV